MVLMLTNALRMQAQQKPMYSQYMFNTFLTNPAAAGAEGTTSINFTSREQWLGLDNSPKTNAISAQTRILKNSFIAKALNLRKKFSRRSSSGRVGVGAYIYNDMSGPISRTGMQLTYAYHIPLRQSQLSFGLALETFQFKVDKSLLKNYDVNDDLITKSKLTKYIIDGNFGAQFTAPLYFVGLSVSDLFKSSINFGDSYSQGLQLERHYYLSGGYKIEINRYVMVEPTSLMKFTESGAFQMDLSARAYYRADYWGGLAYRTGADGGAIIILAGLKYNKFYFGYAFDITLSPIMTHTIGTHEFMLTVKFGENARRYRWLNRY